MLACDFFTVEIAWLQRLHVRIFIEIASRDGASVTAHPMAATVANLSLTAAKADLIGRNSPSATSCARSTDACEAC